MHCFDADCSILLQLGSHDSVVLWSSFSEWVGLGLSTLSVTFSHISCKFTEVGRDGAPLQPRSACFLFACVFSILTCTQANLQWMIIFIPQWKGRGAEGRTKVTSARRWRTTGINCNKGSILSTMQADSHHLISSQKHVAVSTLIMNGTCFVLVHHWFQINEQNTVRKGSSPFTTARWIWFLQPPNKTRRLCTSAAAEQEWCISTRVGDSTWTALSYIAHTNPIG